MMKGHKGDDEYRCKEGHLEHRGGAEKLSEIEHAVLTSIGME